MHSLVLFVKLVKCDLCTCFIVFFGHLLATAVSEIKWQCKAIFWNSSEQEFPIRKFWNMLKQTFWKKWNYSEKSETIWKIVKNLDVFLLQDDIALTIEDQFLLGNEILIAPVLERHATFRNIYLPKGQWIDSISNEVYDGPLWLSDYPADLFTLPYFTRMNNWNH